MTSLAPKPPPLNYASPDPMRPAKRAMLVTALVALVWAGFNLWLAFGPRHHTPIQKKQAYAMSAARLQVSNLSDPERVQSLLKLVTQARKDHVLPDATISDGEADLGLLLNYAKADAGEASLAAEGREFLAYLSKSYQAGEVADAIGVREHLRNRERRQDFELAARASSIEIRDPPTRALALLALVHRARNEHILPAEEPTRGEIDLVLLLTESVPTTNAIASDPTARDFLAYFARSYPQFSIDKDRASRKVRGDLNAD